MKTITRRQTILLLALAPSLALCADQLPEPLTLEAALNSAQNPAHFELLEVDQRLQALSAELGIEQGNNDFRIDLTGRIRQVGLNDIAEELDVDEDGGDSAASLVLSKPLYDFGLQDSLESTMGLQHQALEMQKQLLIERRRLAIMEKYFAVLNADNQFLSENEALAIGFIRYDNAAQDHELGLVAEIEVLRLQTEYEVIRQKRHLAVQRQRLTRNILAEAMGYPGQLSSDLEIPVVDSERSLLDDIESLVMRAMQFSLEARVAMANTRAAQAAIKIAESADGPTLDLELEVSTYERETRTRDDWRAGLYIEIPLYAGSSPAKVNLAMAKYRQALAHQQQLHSHLRLEVLRLWQQLKQLQLENLGRVVEQDYRDRYLDRSRAEYELEFKTDLGDSMVLYSRSYSERMQTLYAFELAYQKLAALVGADFLQASALLQ
ncbi:MAG: TolC family protein [Gammaproteobacteria bacterium]|nr:TolC family protein [Gammaproteobacteria bacterium]